MPAHTPRRSFASPFVVTLAAAPACWSNAAPPPTQEPVTQPVPQTAQAGSADPTPPVIVANPPRPTAGSADSAPPIPTQNPPPPQPTQTYWTVMKTDKGCSAAIRVECPKPEPGKPMHTCNPPPLRPYACPDNLADLLAAGPVTIVGDGTTCATELVMPTCPPHVMCNPPRPRTVKCPQ
jgi:hypothetical protein